MTTQASSKNSIHLDVIAPTPDVSTHDARYDGVTPSEVHGIPVLRNPDGSLPMTLRREETTNATESISTVESRKKKIGAYVGTLATRAAMLVQLASAKARGYI